MLYSAFKKNLSIHTSDWSKPYMAPLPGYSAPHESKPACGVSFAKLQGSSPAAWEHRKNCEIVQGELSLFVVLQNRHLYWLSMSKLYLVIVFTWVLVLFSTICFTSRILGCKQHKAEWSERIWITIKRDHNIVKHDKYFIIWFDAISKEARERFK